MGSVTTEHFGGNIILTRDSLVSSSPFQQMSQEIGFSHLRYPGGAVTENQTWENGGLNRMFGKPMDPNDKNYVLTIREALDYSSETGHELTIVIPTKQFFDHKSGTFNHAGFDRYMSELDKALLEYHEAKIKDFELGNEYWGDGPGGSLTASEYGKAVNAMLPKVAELRDKIVSDPDSDSNPGIGIQAGSATNSHKGDDGKWNPTGVSESEQIANQISIEYRELVTNIYQHSYPHADKQMNWQVNWAVDPMKVYTEIPGFSHNLTMTMSEFNMHNSSTTGIAQGAAWIEAFSANIDAGVDEFMHWGLNYEWLSTKFYDTKIPESETQNGTVSAIATPMGQIYDLAETHLLGKSTLTDAQATSGMKLSAKIDVTGFSDSSQKVVFFHNNNADDVKIDLGQVGNKHVSVFHLESSDSPHTPVYDEGNATPEAGGPADARGEMHLAAGQGANSLTLGEGEMGVVVISNSGRDLVLEGAHHATDPDSDMVNDSIAGGSGNDVLRGHVGDDTIAGGEGRDVISGGEGDDRLSGGADGDIIFSGEGRDTVSGGNGDDLIVSQGGADGDFSVVHTGSGADTVLIGGGQKVSVTDFSSEDSIGFDGAFEDSEAFNSALTVEGDDLLVALPDKGSVRIVGGAGLQDSFADSVVDFRDDDEIEAFNDQTFNELNQQQIEDFYNNIDDIDGIPEFPIYEMNAVCSYPDQDGQPSQGTVYWEGKDATLDRLEEAPHVPHPHPEEPDTDVPDGKDPEWENDDEEEYRPDEPADYDQQNYSDASGGSCFVATAAYGDRLHPDVVALRAFRDLHLVKSKAGRVFVRAYWVVGPVLARRTQPDDLHARFARFLLSKLVARLTVGGLTGGGQKP